MKSKLAGDSSFQFGVALRVQMACVETAPSETIALWQEANGHSGPPQCRNAQWSCLCRQPWFIIS